MTGLIDSRFTLQIPGHTPGTGSFVSPVSPYTGEPLAEVEQASHATMQKAIQVARSAFAQRHGLLPAHERAAILGRLAASLNRHQEDLALVIAREGGKPLQDARVEAARAVNTITLCAEESTRLHGTEIPMQGSAAAAGRLAFTMREPIGLVAAISAFNHPLNLIAHQVGPAVAAGCPVIVKPSPETQISCLLFMRFLHEAGWPVEWGVATPCSNEVAESLVTSPAISFLSFIGSARVGWMLRSKLAPGVRCTLEHGGAGPVIVDEHADLDATLPALVKGGYYHAGQVCVSVQRVFAHTSLFDAVVERLSAAAAALIVGDPTDEATEVGPLIRAREVERVGSWVQQSLESGAQLHTGGTARPHQCFAPTVVSQATPDSKLMTEEIFGPVVVVQRCESLNDAIERANAVRWSFQAAVFSQDIDRALFAARRLNGAAVMINDHTAFRADWMPFAARGPSGLGTGGVPYGVADLTQEKLVVIKERPL